MQREDAQGFYLNLHASCAWCAIRDSSQRLTYLIAHLPKIFL